MAQSRTRQVPPLVAALVGWLVPGGGYWLIGQRSRALTVGITILAMFVLGLLIGGAHVVEPSSGYIANPMRAILDRPWFIGQFLAGPISLVTALIGQDMPPSHARLNEIGTLYTAVAGMLNLLAVIDSAHRAAQPVKPQRRPAP